MNTTEAITYLALKPGDGGWHHSAFLGDAVTLDYNAQNELIGVEVIGSAATTFNDAMVEWATAAPIVFAEVRRLNEAGFRNEAEETRRQFFGALRDL